MPDIGFVRGEIQRTRLQVLRQRKEIVQLQRAGISTTSAEALLERMLNKIDDLCAERDRLKKKLRRGYPAGCWDGTGEMVRRGAGAFALPQGSGGSSSHGDARKAGAISTFKRSSSPSTNMWKLRPATAISF